MDQKEKGEPFSHVLFKELFYQILKPYLYIISLVWATESVLTQNGSPSKCLCGPAAAVRLGEGP